MKQIDNRQKKQIQMRAASAPQKSGLFGAKQKEKSRMPEPSAKGPETPPTAPAAAPAPLPQAPKVGRNEPCPCASGLKYKKCCLLKSESGSGSSEPAV